MSLSKTLYTLLSTGSTQEDLAQHDLKTVDWDVKNQNNQTNPMELFEKSLNFTQRCLY